MKTSLPRISFTLLAAAFIVISCTAAPPSASKDAPAIVEPVEGSDLNRVTLTEKAAARLGIETAVIQETVATRLRVVGGMVLDPQDVPLPAEAASMAAYAYISVGLFQSDLAGIDQSQPAQVRLNSTEAGDTGQTAEAVTLANPYNFSVPLYFRVQEPDTSLTPGQKVFVEYYLAGSGDMKKAIPYSAILYDLQGNTWVFISPSPLVYVRAPVVIDYIDGDQVFLSDGPAVGTQVVTVGVAQLYGIDTGVDK